ncbi:MAG: germination protein YpeB [Oscillospiraceae bacterium]|nr:germination protein YpeB [Oscillospiraceae bacterium]
MSVKAKRLIAIYTAAAVLALAALAWASWDRLAFYRRETGYASSRAFEEAANAAGELSLTLRALAYVTDDALGRRLCAQAAADARAAETALSVLPFATQELEQTQGYLNRCGDYAMSLVSQADGALGDEARTHLTELSGAAAALSGRLSELRALLSDGGAEMDSREKPLQNLTGGDTPKLSALLLDCEAHFDPPEAFAYEGVFSPRESPAPGTLSESETLKIAARAAGVEPRELKEERTAEGPEGRRCYSAGGLLVGVSARGLEFTAQSRLIGPASIGADEAPAVAERFLEENGFDGLRLDSAGDNGALAVLRYAPMQDGALRPDDGVTVSVALDDGSVYAFDAARYSAEPAPVTWETDLETARAKLPENVSVVSDRRVIRKSPGGTNRAQYEFICTGAEGETVRIYIDAATGRQSEIAF